METCIAHVDESPALFRMLTAMSTTPPAGSEQAAVELSLTSMRVGETLRAVIADGIEAGTFSVDPDVAARILGFALVGLLSARASDKDPAPHDVATEIVTTLVNGIARRPPTPKRAR